MHIYRLETIGSLDGLVAREEASPIPSAGEVLVRVKASALNFRDLAILLGKSPFPVRPGVVPMSDAAGDLDVVVITRAPSSFESCSASMWKRCTARSIRTPCIP